MRFVRSRGFLIAVLAGVIGVPGALLLARNPAGDGSALTARVTRGEFTVTVTTSGELRARKFVQINAPPNTQQAEVYQMRIASIIPEGTV
ncbi:MAG: efflux RND transporter periplasmic adaptor subunit, partial [Gemmatimonadales bacterium]